MDGSDAAHLSGSRQENRTNGVTEMTRKVLMFAAFGAATVAAVCTGANAQAVRLVSEDASSYFADDESPTSTPATPKKPSIGSGLDSLSSPSDVPPNVRPPRPPMPPVRPADPPTPMDPIAPPAAPADPDGYAPPYIEPGCDAYGSPACDGGYASCDGGYASCGDEYAPDSCCCAPCWTVRGEVIIWDYIGNSRGQLLATGSANLTAEDYNFDWSGGPRLTLIRHGVLNGCWDLEMVYWGIDSWQANAGLADVDTIQTTPVTNIGADPVLNSTYGVDVYNAELNLKRASYNGCFTWIFGLRYIELNESLLFDIGGVASESIDTGNHLFGGQIGVEGPLWDQGGSFYVTGVSKMGVFNNSSQTAVRTAGVAGARLYTGTDDDEAAWLAELGLNAGYRLTGNVNLIAGYNLLWIDGIADAPSQLTTHNISTGVGGGVASVENDNTAFLHGVSFGVEWLR
jgi:hypothetical protein